MRADLAAALETVPTAIRRMLREQCGGNWDRVTIEPDGGFMVHNGVQPFTFREPTPAQPQKDEPAKAVAVRNVPRLEPQTETLICRHDGHEWTRTKKRGVKPVWCDEHRVQKKSNPALSGLARAAVVKEARASVALDKDERAQTISLPPVTPRVMRCGRCAADDHLVEDCPLEYPKRERLPEPPKYKLRTVSIDALAAHMGVKRPTIEPVTNVVSAPERHLPKERVEVWHEGDVHGAKVDWETTDLEQSAIRFRDRFKHGLPAGQGFWYLPDVVALYGLDTDMVAAVLRHPARVEVRPESFDKNKRYPVLGFTRGDATVILGLREPARPTVIAVYMTSLLENDTHRVGSSGGGGAKKESGLPSTAAQLRKRLLARGAYLDVDARTNKATVKYASQDLGQISLDPIQAREAVRTSWQRIIRRMHAIDQRTST